MKKNKQQNVKRNNVKRLKLTVFILLAFLTMYIPSLIHWLGSDEMIVDIVRYGSIEESFSQEGLIIRDESVISSPAEGRYIAQRNEGEMVQANSVISLVGRKEIDELLQKRQQLQEKSLVLHKNRTDSRELFSGDLLRIDEEINFTLSKIIGQSNQGYLADLKFHRNELDKSIQKKATIITNTSAKSESVIKVEQEINNLENYINANQVKVTSKHSGIVSYWIDGYESILNSKMIPKITPQEFQKLYNNAVFSTTQDTNVQAGKPFVKVIQNTDYYIALLIDQKNKDLFQMDEHVNIRINENGIKVPGKLYFKSAILDKKLVLFFKCDRLLPKLVGSRKVHVDVIKNNYSGLKIPMQALQNFNQKKMEAQIMALKLRTAKLIEVKVIGYNKDFAIIDNVDTTTNGINLYDTYILNRQNIKEGQIIQ